MKMVAAKRVKYPHGPTGKEYVAGDEFDALSERDAKGLYIAGKATYGKPKNKTDLPRVTKVEEVPVQPEAPLHQSYLRRDMQASRIGADNPSPSLRRGRPPKAQTSTSSEDDSE